MNAPNPAKKKQNFWTPFISEPPEHFSVETNHLGL